ncbi:MAG: secretion system protein Por [Chitinophagaceae bacterium]|nr:MAG: secretion system protein Por [Chitinophagaceae bacterium]
MNLKYIYILFFVICTTTIKAQVLTESNLPIVIITTDKDPNTGLATIIPDEPKVLGSMKIIYRPDGSRNYVTDQNTQGFLQYNGRIGIETRGSSSQFLEKKPYGLTTLADDNRTNNNVSILGMPEENDWILNSLAFDPSLLRDYLSYYLSRSIGNYAARGKYCEVIVNEEYRGLYIFMEKIKIDKERVNIEKIDQTDNNGIRLTGGYIVKADKTNGDPVAWEMETNNGGSVQYIHDTPKPEFINSIQSTYIQSIFNRFKDDMITQNESIKDGYPSDIDVPSFIDYMIINELSSNVDAYQISTYFHKDRGGKLKAGPVWDCNLTYGNDLVFWGYDRSFIDVWQFDNGDNTGSRFWNDLYKNQTYKCHLAKRWKQVSQPNNPLNYTSITKKIDSIISEITEASTREQNKWYSVGNLQTNGNDLKIWLKKRIEWMNTKLGNDDGCPTPVAPLLVISKIHYNPLENYGYTSDNLEFTEITNNSNLKVDMSGLCFSKPGFNFQFPINSTIDPLQKIYLCSDSVAFKKNYGIAALGQFGRNLSNKSQKLVLSDAWGNTIDEVEYKDEAPWPLEADGKGSFLELINLSFDNSLASSWIAKDSAFQEVKIVTSISLFPNPFINQLNIKNGNDYPVDLRVFNSTGQLLEQIKNISAGKEIRLGSNYRSGIYIIEVTGNGEKVIRKVLKS